MKVTSPLVVMAAHIASPDLNFIKPKGYCRSRADFGVFTLLQTAFCILNINAASVAGY